RGASAAPTSLDEVGLQRLPVEPLEHHPGEWCADRRHVGRRTPKPRIQHLHDGWVLQLGDGLRFARKSLALGGLVSHGRFEDLDRNGHVQHGVVPRVDDPEPTLGHDSVDPVLAVEKYSGECKWVQTLRLALGGPHGIVTHSIPPAHGYTTCVFPHRPGAARRLRWLCYSARPASSVLMRGGSSRANAPLWDTLTGSPNEAGATTAASP